MGWKVYDKYGAAKIAPVSVQGSELDYAQITANIAAISATTEATSVAVITGNAVTYDGSKIKITFFTPLAALAAQLNFVLYRDTTPIGQSRINPGNGPGTPVEIEFFDTPTPGSHTYSIKAFVASGTATISAGAGGAGNLLPAFLRVTRADPQVVVKYVGVPGALLGQELDYAQITANTAAISVTTEATSVAVITGNSVTYDGSKVKIEVSIPLVTSNVEADFVIYRDTTPIGRIAVGNFGNAPGLPLKAEMFDTPSAGSHTYSVKAYVGSAGSVLVKCGSGGSGNMTPAFLRVTRAA